MVDAPYFSALRAFAPIVAFNCGPLHMLARAEVASIGAGRVS